MKKLLTSLLLSCLYFFAAAQLLVEPFNYSDGSLVNASTWATHSGTPNQLQVESGKAVIDHSSSEDVSASFIEQSVGEVYFSFILSVDDLGAPYSGADNEYFMHLMTSGNSSFRARVDIVPPSGAGDFSVGISTLGSSADATWATDLTFGIDYTIVVKYDIGANQAELWVDPGSETDTKISGNSGGTAINPAKIAFRQSTSSENEMIRIDNLIVDVIWVVTLPVEFVSFRAKLYESNSVSLSWSTASEENNAHFEIEHSTNSRDFQTLDKVYGVGTTSEIQQYSYIHEGAVTGKNYYRLRQVDFDGAFEYSQVAVVEMKGDGQVNVRPTLADDQVTLSFGEAIREEAQLQVFDIAGRQVNSLLLAPGTEQLELSVASLEKGLYFIQLQLNGDINTLKFVKR